MPLSYWDSLPFEIKSGIIKSSDPLTRYLNNDLTLTEIDQYGTEIWKIAFKINYNGDLAQLPQNHFPNIHNVNIPIIQGWTDELPDWWKDTNVLNLFITSCSIGHLDLVKDLVADVGKYGGPDQHWAVHEAFRNAATFGYVDILKVVLDADMGLDDASYVVSVLEKAAENGQRDVVSFLLDKCMQAYSRGEYEWDKLWTFQRACRFGHIEVVKVLNTVIKVEHYPDHKKSTVMKAAVESRRVDVIKYLVEVAGLNNSSSCNEAFLNAVRVGFVEGVAVLANIACVDLDAGLQVASNCGADEIVKMLSR
ncbi:hypothetical protein HDU76_001151 [Blyttiomyces sp. JEL0837]|nr:hypothetical protein HDU76_001151 [Blyttiomyces sp. JEL0837]